MSRLVFANSAYINHITDEGWQLQEGLREVGWTFVGQGYDGQRDARTIMNHYDPVEALFIQDKRDWDLKSGCPGVPTGISFTQLSRLRAYDGIRTLVVKDGGPEGSDYHHQFCEEVQPHAVVVYYHPMSLMKLSPWLIDYKLIRTYHSINPAHIPPFKPGRSRMDLCGSGAMLGDVYPFRARIAPQAAKFGMTWLQHPGYTNDKGPDTPRYLTFLNEFKVHFATSSAYKFSLRKIIESVACGCTVVTDLPQYDVLPHIDRALVRVKPTISDADLMGVFDEAIASWNEDGRRRWAEKAIAYYNYQACGRRLSQDILSLSL